MKKPDKKAASKIQRLHMQAAHLYAGLSYCKRRQVGCLVVKGERIVSIGYNGTPPGWENKCEGKDGKTYEHVYHAETNAISKLAKYGQAVEGAHLFVTATPCIECSKLIAQTGISHVFYDEPYKNKKGLKLLRKCKIKLTRIQIEKAGIQENKSAKK